MVRVWQFANNRIANRKLSRRLFIRTGNRFTNTIATMKTNKRTLFSFLLILIASSMTLSRANSIYDIDVETIDGETVSLSQYKGKTLLIVNVASKCGFTGQYAGLEELYQKHKDDDFVILGFPCNQFGGQEPGTEEEIAQFCQLNYGVTFPMHAKIDVKGDNQHPLYTFLAGKESPFSGSVKWNFSKFLVGPDGTIIERFGSMTKPMSSKIENAIASAR